MTDTKSESLVDVLKEHCWKDGGNPVLGHVRGAIDAGDVDYKDWYRAMKAGDRKLCLKLTKDDAEKSGYICVDGAGMLRWLVDDDLPAAVPHHSSLEEHIEDPETTIEPVLREDTPFGDLIHE